MSYEAIQRRRGRVTPTFPPKLLSNLPRLAGRVVRENRDRAVRRRVQIRPVVNRVHPITVLVALSSDVREPVRHVVDFRRNGVLRVSALGVGNRSVITPLRTARGERDENCETGEKLLHFFSLSTRYCGSGVLER